MDWPITEDYCQKFGDAFGSKVVFSWKKGGFEGEVKATFITSDGKQALASDGQILALIDMKQKGVIQTMKLARRSADTVSIAPVLARMP